MMNWQCWLHRTDEAVRSDTDMESSRLSRTLGGGARFGVGRVWGGAGLGWGRVGQRLTKQFPHPRTLQNQQRTSSPVCVSNRLFQTRRLFTPAVMYADTNDVH